jgi:hypothetical protein
MSLRAKTILMKLLHLLGVLSVSALALNPSLSSRATVTKTSYQQLLRDPDFTRAVKAIVEECSVNVDTAKVTC